jgi:hypothetical protein
MRAPDFVTNRYGEANVCGGDFRVWPPTRVPRVLPLATAQRAEAVDAFDRTIGNAHA